MGKIIAYEKVGTMESYDLEVGHRDHQYYLTNGALSSNCHATAYSIISYQCAWLYEHYPVEWVASFLDKEPEKRKEKAIMLAKGAGFEIAPLDINTSGLVWEISEDGRTLIQPLTSIKGLGDSAMAQVLAHRPFENIEEFLFNKDIVYSKLNKKAIDVLIRSNAMHPLVDDRFTGLKHFWSAVAVDRPKNLKNFKENIELYAPEGSFTDEEMIQYEVDLTGIFPFNKVMSSRVREKLEEKNIPPLGEFDENLQVAWFVPRKVTSRKTKRGKEYWILEVTDSSNKTSSIKCWGVKAGKDLIHINRPYMAKLDYSRQWGFSSRSIYHNFRLLG